MQVPFFGIGPSVTFLFGLLEVGTFPFVATLMAAQSGRQTSAHPPLPGLTIHPSRGPRGLDELVELEEEEALAETNAPTGLRQQGAPVELVCVVHFKPLGPPTVKLGKLPTLMVVVVVVDGLAGLAGLSARRWR